MVLSDRDETYLSRKRTSSRSEGNTPAVGARQAVRSVGQERLMFDDKKCKSLLVDWSFGLFAGLLVGSSVGFLVVL